MKKGKINIGTSGWHYQHWVGSFYPENTRSSEQLSYYHKYFTTVEINNSFYRTPTPGTFESWKNTVPDDFVFSVKANRYITHMKKLKVEKQDITDFLHNVDHLEKKAGPVLFQLPPNWNPNHQRLHEFLSLLPANRRYTLEFRNASWYKEKVYELLREYNCAFCIYELGGHHSPVVVTADFVYVRLHGPGENYQGNYPAATLKKWAKSCINWQQEGKDVYVYFDNDQQGHAALNAKDLKKLIEE